MVTSGNFQGSLSINNYFPFLSGQTEFLSSNPSVAGPFEDRGRSGTRIGAKVQIVSEIAKDNQGDYCNFSQHYWVGSEVVGGGFPRHKRGVTIDDIATSGQIQSQAPFRQDINGNPSTFGGINGCYELAILVYDVP